MKRRNVSTLICCLFAIGLMTINGCKKKETPIDSNTSVASDNALVQDETNNVLNATNSTYHDQSGNRMMSGSSLLPACTTITGNPIDTGVLRPGHHTMIIDFGTVPCQCTNWDNKFRKGQIIANWDSSYRDSGTVVTITTNGYCISQDNGIHYDTLSLTFTITNKGINAANHPTYSGHSVASYVTDSGKISWTSDCHLEWIFGYGTTIDIMHSQFTLTGTAAGTSRKGVAFTVNVTSPIQFDVNCKYTVVSGKLDIIEGTLSVRHVDFGNGSCSGKATVDIDGTIYDIYL